MLALFQLTQAVAIKIVFYEALIGTFLCFVYMRAYMDYWLIELKDVDLKGAYKFCTSIITYLVCGYVTLLISLGTETNVFLLVGTLLLSYGFLFDTWLNWLRGKPRDYLGSGPVDTFWSIIPYQFYVRLTLLIILICLNIRLLL